MVDILNVLYNSVMDISPENFEENCRDHFILSKGHCVEALYAVLGDRGFFPKGLLKTVSKPESDFIGHPNNKIPGIEMNSGSLGHGLSVAVGMALALKKDCPGKYAYVVMGDGELAEGSVWEGAMAAGHFALSNLVALVDRNRLQISGPTEKVMAQDDVAQRFSSFGWNVISCEGNNVKSLLEAFEQAKTETEKPSLIVAQTTKGCGISFMENQAGWHHRVPTDEEYAKAIQELEAREADIQ